MVKKIIVLLAILFFTVGNTSAQEKLIEKANNKYKSYAFSPAIDIYTKVIEKGFVSAELLSKLANSYYFNADYKKASEIYQKLVSEFEADVTAEQYFKYAQTLRTLGEYDKSNAILEKFYDVASSGEKALFAKDTVASFNKIKANTDKFKISKFKYNSVHNEFAPTFFKEGLLFSSDRDTGNFAKYRHTWNSRDFLDLYKVNVDSVSFNKVIKLDKNVNTRYHESTSAITKDGTTMYFTRNNYKDGKKVKDRDGVVRLKIFRADYVNGIWTNITELPFNSDDYSVAHPTLSTDEKTLYFASNMPGTLGMSDIFSVSINDDDTYGTPLNLGNKINTEERETFPYVSNEGILYFSSDGHLGLGGLDIFATKIANNNFTGSIVNVGEPVNSNMDDFTFIFDSENRNGYFASNRKGGLGEDDIYAVVENEPLVLDCVQQITGTVRDKISNEVLVGAAIKVIDENNEEISSTIMSSNGVYNITLDCNQGNFVRAVVEGYVPSEKYLSKSNGEPQVIDFYLERDKVTAGAGDDLAKLLQLSTIYFDLNKFDIRPDAEIEIQKVIVAMEKFPSLKIKVNSHTDSRGKDSYNLWLSQKRAKATVNYMVSKGIDASRLQGEGFGETKLVNKCENGIPCTVKEHQLNRRSEFIIIE
ncbi:OmpA family protein [Cellulophaga omnivescoria]|uniref:OmpA family protein n=1 Tax=Cellulophaga omnivescoria TaxID=1888890 RepID=UPI00098714D4|nr:OmpA family protein [Cellulophaga omnivescoria]